MIPSPLSLPLLPLDPVRYLTERGEGGDEWREGSGKGGKGCGCVGVELNQGFRSWGFLCPSVENCFEWLCGGREGGGGGEGRGGGREKEEEVERKRRDREGGKGTVQEDGEEVKQREERNG